MCCVVCMYVYVCVCVYVCERMHVYARAHTHTRVCVCVCVCVCPAGTAMQIVCVDHSTFEHTDNVRSTELYSQLVLLLFTKIK